MKYKTILLYLVIILISLNLLSCNKDSNINSLNHRIDELVNTIEKREEQNIKNYLADDFSVAQKSNKTQFFLFVRHHLKRNKNVLISINDKKITFNENYADVTANVLLLGSNEWLPERGQMYFIASRWKKERGDWMMSKLLWDKK